MAEAGLIISGLGSVMIAGLLTHSAVVKKEEKYTNDTYPRPPMFYQSKKYDPRMALRSPNAYQPSSSINFDETGSQALAYQLYQQAVNASVPTLAQLQSISGQSQEQTGIGAEMLGGGLSSKTAPYALLLGDKVSNEFQAVNYGSERAQSISACAQNAPSFVSTSLLPKPVNPGEETWEVNAPNNILANQQFLSAVQQIGTDTTLSSRRNQSYDIRPTIPNPINVVSPFNQSTIMPDLERRPLSCWIPQDQGLYGCGSPGVNTNPTYVDY